MFTAVFWKIRCSKILFFVFFLAVYKRIGTASHPRPQEGEGGTRRVLARAQAQTQARGRVQLRVRVRMR